MLIYNKSNNKYVLSKTYGCLMQMSYAESSKMSFLHFFQKALR